MVEQRVFVDGNLVMTLIRGEGKLSEEQIAELWKIPDVLYSVQVGSSDAPPIAPLVHSRVKAMYAVDRTNRDTFLTIIPPNAPIFNGYFGWRETRHIFRETKSEVEEE